MNCHLVHFRGSSVPTSTLPPRDPPPALWPTSGEWSGSWIALPLSWLPNWRKKTRCLFPLETTCYESVGYVMSSILPPPPNTQKKCEQYWPSYGSTTYGNVQVTLKEAENLAEYSIRTFSVSPVSVLPWIPVSS